ncbi:MAG: hypothetical protein NBV67_04020 [Tagaea sp.]|nr:hypothetical protein [Tagaea sp.]
MRLRRVAFVGALAVATLPLSGCVDANQKALEIGQPPAGALELRNLQTRRFGTLDTLALFQAATQTLQDLGYTVTESALDVGVLVASKQRDARETAQVTGQVALTILFALMGTAYTPTWDQEQTINVTLVATPIVNSNQIEVRASFDRSLLNNHGHKWRAELLLEPELYREFFDKFSQSAFLEAERL